MLIYRNVEGVRHQRKVGNSCLKGLGTSGTWFLNEIESTGFYELEDQITTALIMVFRLESACHGDLALIENYKSMSHFKMKATTGIVDGMSERRTSCKAYELRYHVSNLKPSENISTNDCLPKASIGRCKEKQISIVRKKIG